MCSVKEFCRGYSYGLEYNASFACDSYTSIDPLSFKTFCYGLTLDKCGNTNTDT